MKGFKTFRNKTSVPFFEGLTAIVGENGSGKSNLIEAISFVMGKRSSQLRAKKLEQLIFNGGESKKPSQYAQVTLHLANKNGLFDPFLENGKRDEITIGRKVTQGYSTYRFMEKNCSRELIDQILEACQIDPDGQHFIEQGNITEIIKKTPSKRREVIDEISGVSAYEEKKEESIEKLQEVKEKLNTNRVVLAERRSRLRELRNEREAALEYNQLREEKKVLEASIEHLKRRHLERKLNKATAQEEDLDDEIAAVEQKKQNLSLEIKNIEWELESLRDKMDKSAQVALVKETEHLRTQIVREQGQIHTKKNRIENLEETLHELKDLQKRHRSSSRQNRAVNVLLELGKEGIYGTVAQLMKPKEGYEVAIEVACGGHKQDLVMGSRDTALESINYLKKNNLGRARILPLDKLTTRPPSSKAKRAKSMEGVFDLAINLVKFDQRYEAAFKYVFRDTLIAESLEAVKDLEGVRVVTLDGDVLSPGGAMTGGKAVKRKPKSERMRRYKINTSKKKEEIKRLKGEIGKAKQKIKTLEKKLEDKEKETEDESMQAKELRMETNRKSAKLKELKNELSDITTELEDRKRELTRVKSKIENLRDEIKNIKDTEPDQELVEGSLPELKKRLKEAIRGMELLTPVNMKAIEEYEKFKENLTILEQRISELKREKKKIERFIGQIETKKKEQFLTTLNEISEEFNNIFQKLFEGGKGRLELEEPGNIESGLLIKAHPPNKEPHVLDSLSGGEKALTAIAFVFAIQKHRYSPFYIMDEIDAALDGTNSKRISTLLKEYSEDAQLIMVSHNQETVRVADRAYGVSIQDGVSKVLSIELD